MSVEPAIRTEAACGTDLRSRPARAWLELLRIPNALTLPGNVLAGVALSVVPFAQWNGSRLVLTILSALLLYGFGLLSNDLADLEEDRRDRPGRPLPSGRVSVQRAQVAAGFCAAFGALAAFLAGPRSGALALAILALSAAYNHGWKRRAAVGIPMLAACRGLLLLMGAATTDLPLSSLQGWAAGWMGLHVAAISLAARDETRDAPSEFLRSLPFWTLAAGFGVGLFLPGTVDSGSRFGAAVLACILPMRYWALGSDPRYTPRWIGMLIGNLCLAQAAAVIWIAPDLRQIALMIGLACLAPLHAFLASHIHAS